MRVLISRSREVLGGTCDRSEKRCHPGSSFSLFLDNRILCDKSYCHGDSPGSIGIHVTTNGWLTLCSWCGRRRLGTRPRSALLLGAEPGAASQAREKAAAAVGFGRKNETMRNGLLRSLSRAGTAGRTFLLSQDLGYCAA